MVKLHDENRRAKPHPQSSRVETKTAHRPLMSYLVAEAQKRNDSLKELAAHLGIGYPYLAKLCKGDSDTAKIGRPVLVAAAKYLDVPIAEVYLWAGVLQPTDFVHEGEFKAISGDPFDVISRHPQWGGFMPARKEWDAMSPRARQMVVLAFERASGANLMGKTMVPEMFKDGH